MKYQLMELPYDNKALEPYMSSETFSYHYDKHHRTYVNNLNKLLATTDEEELQSLTLEELVKASHGRTDLIGIFNNGAQVLNHDFFWLSMMPKGGQITAHMKGLIEESFGSLTSFKQKFIEMGLSQFGSGWVWLVQDPTSQRLSIVKTGNADNPILINKVPLITCDLWEHAYYIDYRNKRAEYLEIFLDKLVNWSFAEQNLV
jgi:Fe-Mn family superoxide dismutase